MVNIQDKSACCGCAACVQVCPKQCIGFNEDNEGFRYPAVDVDACIDCGLCEKVCPITCHKGPRKPVTVYAAKNNDDVVRQQSSSGGVFTLLAREVISGGGVVFGAAFDEFWEVVHRYAEDLEGLTAFMGSKYLQSRIGDSYKKAEEFLRIGKRVLFSGTPCQVAGLKSFLRKDYDELLTVEVICHGVPSPLVWRTYIKDISVDQNISEINFRSKRESWKRYSVVIRSKDRKILDQPFYENPYMKGFLSDIYLRPSCHACSFKSGSSGSDITLGDFWGVENYLPKFDDDKGVSAVIVNTERGRVLIESLNLDKRDVSYENVLKGNPSLEESAKIPLRYRNIFWSQPSSVDAITKVLSKMKPGFVRKCIVKVMNFIRMCR